ncbi:hypothetical protein FUAX_28710 [Fulvitalea axinellae]|uniref:Right handed beta helix domain-containing protein n=2 Tax=Fulvitalea axinellae TaxID=1182444 RepID=A0AAU9CE54_9BACT|nr:hypothetical protein FUAX_28710 [Fulvitalea axinellae]
MLLALAFFTACNEGEPAFENPPEKKELKVATLPQTDSGVTTANFNGEILSEGETQIEKASFYYWVQGDMSTRTEVPIDLEADKVDGATGRYSVSLDNLQSFTDYSYIFAVTDESGRVDGEAISFSTLISSEVEEPAVSTGDAEGVYFGGADIKGTLLGDGNGSKLNVVIAFWKKGFPEGRRYQSVPEDEDGNLIFDEDNGFVVSLKGLSPGQAYVYQAVVQNELAIGEGEIKEFVTNTQIFVDATAPEGGNGSSWESALNSVKDAMSKAEAGVEIWVSAKGEFNESKIMLKKDVKLMGGFAGTEDSADQRDPDLKTVIDGTNPSATYSSLDTPILEMEAAAFDDVCEIERFVFKNGLNYLGGVMFKRQGSPSFTDCEFRNNSAKVGGAFFGYGDESRFVRCLFEGNFATGRAGAIGFSNGTKKSSTYYEECIFRDNNAPNYGVGQLAGDLVFRNCTFENNTASKWGLFHFYKTGCPQFQGNTVLIGDNLGDNSLHVRDQRNCGGSYPADWKVSN